MNTVIFDNDGLLIDSERIINRALIWAGERMGLADMENTALAMVGRTQASARLLCTEKYGVNFDYDRLCDLKHEYIDGVLSDGYFPAKSGAREITRRLKEKGFHIAVASSSRRGYVEEELKYTGLFDLFEVILCGDNVTKSKPDPQIFLTAAQRLNVSPEECYVLEDSYNGIRAAHAAGMKPIMVPDLLPPDDEMKRLAVFIADDLIAAGEYILGQNP
ncbi:MAG: HAD family hydrolase [Oscillospiraceae bacterium]